MKTISFLLLALILFLSACSGSRYGRIPKGKKQKHTTISKKQFSKRKLHNLPPIDHRGLSVNDTHVLYTPQIAIVTPVFIEKQQGNTAKPLSNNSIKKQAKSNKIEGQQKQTKTQVGSTTEGINYIIRGIGLMTLGVFIALIFSPPLGMAIYIIGSIMIILGILKLFSIF